MNFNLRDFNLEKDLEMVKQWWEFWRWRDRVDPQILSDIGYIIEKDGQSLCVGWLYTTNSLVANLNFITVNPHSDRKLSSEALDFLIECLCQRALKEGSRAISITISNPSLANRIKRLGFVDNGGALTHYIRLKWE